MYNNLGILPALSCRMTQVTRVKHVTGPRYLRPIDGQMLYTDIDFEYHSHHLTIFIQTLN